MRKNHIIPFLIGLMITLSVMTAALSACSSAPSDGGNTTTESSRESLPATEAPTEEETDTAPASEPTSVTETEPATEPASSAASESETATETEPVPLPTTMSEEVFSTLCGVARFSGAYTYDVQENDEYDARLYIDTIFAAEHIWQREYDPTTGEVFYDSVYGKSGRRLTLITHNADNTISELVSDDFFESYYNPFDLLSPADLVQEEDGVYVLSDKEKAKAASLALTGWEESVADFRVYVENGVAVRVVITTATIHPSEELSYISTYDFAISERGTAALAPSCILPYERTADHDALENALKAAQASGSFTIRHQGHEVGYVEPEGGETRPGYGDTDYFVYVLPDLLYDAYVGEEHGFKLMGGYVYPFDLDMAGKVVLHDPVDVSGIEALSPRMTDFKVELFRCLGEGVYTLHDPSTAQVIAPLFAVGNEQASYSFATDFTIKLSEGRLWQVVFTYKTYGIEETVTLTYDFDSSINIDLDFDSASKESVLDAYIGQYRDDDGHFCHVDESGFLLDGTEVEVVGYDSEYGIFTGLWEGKTIYIQKLSTLQLMVYTDDYSMTWTLTSIDDSNGDISIPAAYRGTWEYNDNRIHDVFRLQTHMIFCNDEPLTLISYTESEGVTATCRVKGSVYEGQTFNFHLRDGIMLVTLITEDLTLEPFTIQKIADDPGVEITSEFVGIYLSADGSRKVVITYAGITVDGLPFTPSSFSTSGGFVGSWNGIEGYILQFYGVGGTVNKDRLLIGTPGDNATLDRVASLNEKYIGTWRSTEREYTIVITDTSITINEKAVTFRFDPEYGYAFETEGAPYTVYLLHGVNAYGNEFIAMYDDHDLMYVLFPAETSVLPEGFVGVWKGNDSAHDWKVTVAADGSVALLRDGEALTADSPATLSDENTLSFAVDHALWYLILSDDKDLLSLYCVDEADVDLTRAAALVIPDAFCGDWSSEDGQYVLHITADSFTFLLDNNEATINEMWEEDGALFFTADGLTYLLDANYGDALMLMRDDYSLFKYLSHIPV